MIKSIRAIKPIDCAMVVALLVAACTPARTPEPDAETPRAKQEPAPRTSERLAARAVAPVGIPPLTAGAHVTGFLDWLGAAPTLQSDQARRLVSDAGKNPEVVGALVREVERTQRSDYTRALLSLAVLGETRSDAAVSYLEGFANSPLPERGTVVDGEIVEQTRQAQLQAKAVDGLAYANTPASNAAVKRIIADHPSRIVRAEAINAFLWNHGDSDDAKRELSSVVRPEEVIFLHRVRRVPGESAETFNAKVREFEQFSQSAPAPQRRPGAPPPTPPEPELEDPPPPF
jgi:hypothetical protein